TTVKVQFSESMAASSITTSTIFLKDSSNALVPATVSYDSSSNSATLTPSSPLALSTTFTETVKGGSGGVTDSAGNALAANYTWSFSTGAPTSCPCSIWSSTATPTAPSVSDANAYELGVKFRSDVSGFVSGVRFYKGPDNTGTHIGHLWSATGTLLASATFTSETATGWQQVSFASPVAISANTTYVGSYTDPNGGYAADQ